MKYFRTQQKPLGSQTKKINHSSKLTFQITFIPHEIQQQQQQFNFVFYETKDKRRWKKQRFKTKHRNEKVQTSNNNTGQQKVLMTYNKS